MFHSTAGRDSLISSNKRVRGTSISSNREERVSLYHPTRSRVPLIYPSGGLRITPGSSKRDVRGNLLEGICLPVCTASQNSEKFVSNGRNNKTWNTIRKDVRKSSAHCCLFPLLFVPYRFKWKSLILKFMVFSQFEGINIVIEQSSKCQHG